MANFEFSEPDDETSQRFEMSPVRESSDQERSRASNEKNIPADSRGESDFGEKRAEEEKQKSEKIAAILQEISEEKPSQEPRETRNVVDHDTAMMDVVKEDIRATAVGREEIAREEGVPFALISTRELRKRDEDHWGSMYGPNGPKAAQGELDKREHENIAERMAFGIARSIGRIPFRLFNRIKDGFGYVTSLHSEERPLEEQRAKVERLKYNPFLRGIAEEEEKRIEREERERR